MLYPRNWQVVPLLAVAIEDGMVAKRLFRMVPLPLLAVLRVDAKEPVVELVARPQHLVQLIWPGRLQNVVRFH